MSCAEVFKFLLLHSEMALKKRNVQCKQYSMVLDCCTVLDFLLLQHDFKDITVLWVISAVMPLCTNDALQLIHFIASSSGWLSPHHRLNLLFAPLSMLPLSLLSPRKPWSSLCYCTGRMEKRITIHWLPFSCLTFYSFNK